MYEASDSVLSLCYTGGITHVLLGGCCCDVYLLLTARIRQASQYQYWFVQGLVLRGGQLCVLARPIFEDLPLGMRTLLLIVHLWGAAWHVGRH